MTAESPRQLARTRQRNAVYHYQRARCAVLALTVIASVAAPQAHANDGFGALGAGGIIVGHIDRIALTHEALDISQTGINVTYTFLNQSDQDITAPVSFPLPPYSAFPWGLAPPRAAPPNFRVDVFGPSGTGIGQPSFSTRVWAVVNGADITPQLASLGFSERDIALMPFDEITEAHPYLNRSAAVIAALRDAGWVNKDDQPMWDVHVAYEWQQLFPAQQILHIRHFYRPFYSGGAASGYAGPDDDAFGDEWLRKSFCANDDMVNRMHALFERKNDLGPYGTVPGIEVDYVLQTGNTWKDGIEDFDLTVWPQSPYELVAFCLDGTEAPLTEVSATGWARHAVVRHYKQFHPSTDLKILFANAWYGDWFTGDSRPAFGNRRDLK
jgi:hypothetical protein